MQSANCTSLTERDSCWSGRCDVGLDGQADTHGGSETAGRTGRLCSVAVF